VPCKHLCIVGLGMIGGSLAAALRKANFGGTISALVRSANTGHRGVELGYINSFSTQPADLIPKADMIMLCVPMLSMKQQMLAIAPYVDAAAIITDAGSVKSPFIDDARSVFNSLKRVVPGHPIAGREKTGVDAADAILFNDRRVLLTPSDDVDQNAVDAVTRLWKLTGASVESLSPEHHDRVLAATSHLPHVLAYALVDTLATGQEAEEIFRYAAGGFRDFTRIASSDPVMWRDVCISNRDAILQSIDNLNTHLSSLRSAIEAGDADKIETIMSTTAQSSQPSDANKVQQTIRQRKTSKIMLPWELRAQVAADWTAEYQADLEQMISSAACAPFHRRAHELHRAEPLNALMPWRFYVLSGESLSNLLTHFEQQVQHSEHPKWQRAWQSKIKDMLSACGALVQATWLPDPTSDDESGPAVSSELPELSRNNIEHIAAAGAAVQNLLLAAESYQWLSYWSSGGILRDTQIFEYLGISQEEHLLGSIFLSPQAHPQARVVPGGLRDQRGELNGWVRFIES